MLVILNRMIMIMTKNIFIIFIILIMKYLNIIINNKNEITQLIGVGQSYSFIIIWNFHNGDKLFDIYLKSNIFSVFDTIHIFYPFLWDGKHLCFRISNDINKGKCGVYSLKLFDLKQLKFCDNLINLKNRRFLMVAKSEHPIYGECLITKMFLHEIGLWRKINNENI